MLFNKTPMPPRPVELSFRGGLLLHVRHVDHLAPPPRACAKARVPERYRGVMPLDLAARSSRITPGRGSFYFVLKFDWLTWIPGSGHRHVCIPVLDDNLSLMVGILQGGNPAESTSLSPLLSAPMTTDTKPCAPDDTACRKTKQEKANTKQGGHSCRPPTKLDGPAVPGRGARVLAAQPPRGKGVGCQCQQVRALALSGTSACPWAPSAEMTATRERLTPSERSRRSARRDSRRRWPRRIAS